MLELIVYPKPKNGSTINYSPFCAKSETFMSLVGVEHQVVEFVGNPKDFPNAKLPVLKHDGKVIADSFFIQKYIENELGKNMDTHLSSSEHAQGFAFSKMMEEYLYWPLLIERWLVDENWEKLKVVYFSAIPAMIRPLATAMIRKGVKKSAMGHGMGRHSFEDVYLLGVHGIKAVADFLGDKKFLFGDKVSSYDATAYGFLYNIISCDLNPKLQSEIKQHSNILAYCDRVAELIS